uniref:Tyrosine-protein phosphatase domain-containing protein n=1 Tax=Macrostomum lignano TaxID=282301 RepID=A0A1I8FHH4_9PLAT
RNPAAVSELSSQLEPADAGDSTLLISFVETKTTRNDLVDWSVGQQRLQGAVPAGSGCREKASARWRRARVDPTGRGGCSGEEDSRRVAPNSPTGSWSDDRITTDMDITTGHLILAVTTSTPAYIYDSDPKTKAYILTQGPMESTAPDFWQNGCWNAALWPLLNLTGLGGADCGGDLCTMYWPATRGSIWCPSTSGSKDFIVRNFYLKNVGTGEARTRDHVSTFLAWEEAGLPSSAKAFAGLPAWFTVATAAAGRGTTACWTWHSRRIAKASRRSTWPPALEHLPDQRRDWSKKDS